jgi:phosphoribosylformimino-5-aminoimidazole carboxamide ribotide isomerase
MRRLADMSGSPGRAVHVTPVIDLLGGQVVRGVGGRRESYRPIAGKLASDAQPASVARAFRELGFRQAYLADLDAIAGAEPAWESYEAIAAGGLNLWIDAGLGERQQMRRMAQFAAKHGWLNGVIVGLESLGDAALLPWIVDQVGAERLIFSLDLRGGAPVSRDERWLAATPVEIAADVIAAGVRRMIVLDVAQVGLGQGPGVLELCRQLRDRWPALELITGGGLRSPADLAPLRAAGCDAALVASALHEFPEAWDDATLNNDSHLL